MIPKRLEDIEFSDLEALLSNQVAEGKTIEYKEIIPSNADSDKVKFLAGVSAFANTVGGDFLIGIKAKDGIPAELSGLTLSDSEIDAEILRLEQMLQNSLEPRLPSFSIKDDLKSPTGERFILVRVDRSWIAPHKVKVNEKFYGRNSKGKYPLDVSELRTAFMLTEQLSERIKFFRSSRVEKIKTNHELPVELTEGGRMILHLIPLSAFTTSENINLTEAKNSFDLSINFGAFNKKINIDGVFSFSKNANTQKSDWYIQLFRNGCIETVYTLNQTLYSDFESPLFKSFIEERKFLTKLNIELPIYIFVSMVNVKGYKLNSNDFYRTVINPIDREDLLLPEVTLINNEEKSEELLRPLFDMLWNTFGLNQCSNFDTEGNYKPRY